MVTIARTELQELLDSPRETLDVEYKEWLDLVGNNEARAALARHIAALANHGGGAIVFGFTDDMQAAGLNAFPRVVYHRDLVAGIVKRYLDPPFQCDVQMVKSAVGNDHPVIIVPPHGAVPVCAKAGGPVINGRPSGIIQGVYYVRKPGPESAAVLSPAEWGPIIRRCAMHERTAILGAIDAALRGASVPAATIMDALKIWHDAAHSVFLNDVANRGLPPLSKSHCQFSYALERQDGQLLNAGQLIEILRQVNGEVRDLVRTGWSMFYPFAGRGEPHFVIDENSGQGEHDFLECAHLRHDHPHFLAADMWRASADGKATIIRGYWEDDIGYTHTGLAQGTWFSPNMLIRALVEFVRHARGLAERFREPTTASFRCEWHGLSNRRLFDPMARWIDITATARNDHRVITHSWPVSMLSSSWQDIFAELAAPVLRVFSGDLVLSADWVRGQAPKWLEA